MSENREGTHHSSPRPLKSICRSTLEAVADIGDGATVMIGGFGGSGAPVELMWALHQLHKQTGSPRGLTIVNNNAGNGRIGIAALLDAGMVSKVICSFPRSADPRAFEEQYRAGKVELELVPQGTLAERIRAGGAGIPAFYTPTAADTALAEGREVRTFGDTTCLLELGIKADFALIKADKADTHGNLTYRLASRNFSPLMCMASDVTIVQASRVVPLGGIDPEHVVTPGIFVDRLVEVPKPEQEEALVRAGRAW